MKELLITDLDGTLLNDKKEISKKNIEAILNFKKEGNQVMIATGRSPQQIKDINKEADFESVAITCNGAFIIDMKTKEKLYTKELKKKQLKLLEKIFFNNKVSLNFYGEEYIYYYMEDSRIRKFKHKKETKIKEIKCSEEIEETIYKAIFYFEKESKIEKIDLKKEVIKNLNNVNICYSTDNIMDINYKNVNKKTAIKWIRKNYDFKKIIAIGDGENDIDMLKEADYSIGMANAVKGVKEIVDYITDSNEEDGFASAIKKKFWR